MSDYDNWKTTPPESDDHCPNCYSHEVVIDFAITGDGEKEEIATCLSCGEQCEPCKLMAEWEVEEEQRIEAGERLYDERREEGWE
jgi:hypothetical protein